MLASKISKLNICKHYPNIAIILPSKCSERRNGHIVSDADQTQEPKRKTKVLGIGKINCFASARLLFLQNSLSPFVEEGHDEGGHERQQTSGRCQHQCRAEASIAMKLQVVLDKIVNGNHNHKVDRAAHPSRTQLQSKHHVQFSIFEPADGISILSHCQ